MNERPLVSIIVPVYNTESYLRRCLDSVLQQTYRHLEVVLVDDGSTDSSGEICETYARTDARVRVIHKENGGVSTARNVGLSAIQGSYYSFLDSDDLFLPNTVERFVECALENKADIVCGDFVHMHDMSREADPAPIVRQPLELYCGDSFLIQALEDKRITYSSCGKLFSKRKFDAIRFDASIRIHEDALYVFECAMQDPTVAVLREAVYVYAYRSESASHSTFSEKYLDILKVFERKERLISSQRSEFLPYMKVLLVKSRMALLGLLSNTFDRRWRSYERLCLREIRENKSAFVADSSLNRRFFFLACHPVLYYSYKIALYFKRKVRGEG